MQTTIITPVMKYWSVTKHPFSDYILKEEELKLFVNREYEIERLENCLSNRLNGIFGLPGVGKSSFLRMFQKKLQVKLPVVYVHMSGGSEKSIIREILAQVLLKLNSGELKSGKKLDVKKELQRLHSTIQFSKESEIGATAVVTGRLKESTSNSTTTHTEESALMLLRDVFQKTSSEFVVVIDDLERLAYHFDDPMEYFKFVLTFTRNIDEGLSTSGTSFIVSLDERFSNHIKSNGPGINQDNSFSYGALIEIKTFRPQTLMEVINRRVIQTIGKPAEEFIEIEAFWALQAISSGHARRALSILRAAMEWVAQMKKPLVLTRDAILNGARIREIEFDPDLINITDYLVKNRSCTLSDLSGSLLSIPKRTLLRKMGELEKRLYLKVENIPPNQKKLYKLIKLDC